MGRESQIREAVESAVPVCGRIDRRLELAVAVDPRSPTHRAGDAAAARVDAALMTSRFVAKVHVVRQVVPIAVRLGETIESVGGTRRNSDGREGEPRERAPNRHKCGYDGKDMTQVGDGRPMLDDVV